MSKTSIVTPELVDEAFVPSLSGDVSDPTDREFFEGRRDLSPDSSRKGLSLAPTEPIQQTRRALASHGEVYTLAPGMTPLTPENMGQVLEGLWVVAFRAPSCAPCRSQKERFIALHRDYGSKTTIRFGTFDTDMFGDSGIPARFQVSSIPTVLFMKNGQELNRVVGCYPQESSPHRLEQTMAKFAEEQIN